MIKNCGNDEFILRVNKTSFKIRLREIVIHNSDANAIIMYYLYPVNRSDHWSLCRKLRCGNLSLAVNEFNKCHVEKGESTYIAHRYIYNSPLFSSKKGCIRFLHFLDVRYNMESKKRDIFIDLDLSC